MELWTLFRKLVWQNRKQGPVKYFRATLVHILRKQGDCPVCLFCEERLKKFYWWYFYENCGQSPWVIRVLKCNGFCNRHAWHIVEMKKGNQMSFVYKYLVRNILTKLEKMTSQKRKESGENIKPTDICPVCEEITSTSTLWIQQLVEYLEDSEIQELYFGSSGLCMNHFDQAFNFASTKVALILIEKQARELNRLSVRLEKCSSTRAGQPYEVEKEKAWIKAMGFFAGKEL